MVKKRSFLIRFKIKSFFYDPYTVKIIGGIIGGVILAFILVYCFNNFNSFNNKKHTILEPLDTLKIENKKGIQDSIVKDTIKKL